MRKYLWGGIRGVTVGIYLIKSYNKKTGLLERNELIVVVDKVAHLVLFVNNSIKQRPPQIIKQKMNNRKRLLKAQKINPCNHWRDKIKVLNHEIKVQSTYWEWPPVNSWSLSTSMFFIFCQGLSLFDLHLFLPFLIKMLRITPALFFY